MQKTICFEQKQQKGIKLWFTEFLQWVNTHQYGKDEMNAQNNHGTCRAIQVASFSRLTKNNELIDFCRNCINKYFYQNRRLKMVVSPQELSFNKPFG